MKSSTEVTPATTETSRVERARRLFITLARRGSVMHKGRIVPIRADERGLSLVEGLVAAALVAIAFVAVSSLFPVGYSNIYYGGNQTLAANYAQQKIEQLKNLSFDSINATNCSSSGENLGNGFSRTCTLTLSVGVVGSLQGDMKKVGVTVTWPDRYRPGSLSVETLFTR